MSKKKSCLLCILLFILVSYSFTACGETEREDEVNEPQKEVHVDDDINDVDPIQDIEEWFTVLCSPELGGRYSGSEGIGKAVDYILDIIGRSDSLEIDTFDTYKGEMKNIIFHIKGECDSLVVLGAHYDAFGYNNKIALPGADDNMSGVAVLLRVIRLLQGAKMTPRYNLDVCFWDGEEIGRFGSKMYVQNKKDYKHMSYINVDTVGNDEYYTVTLTYSPEYAFCTHIFDEFVNELGMPMAEYNPQGFTTDCEPFIREHIPFINICCDKIPPYLHKNTDIPSNISYSKVNNLANAIIKHLIDFKL